jgi:Uma2 family endonuclease
MQSDHLEMGFLTVEEFTRFPDDGCRWELVRGRAVKEPPAGFEHSSIGVRIASLLHRYVQVRDLGEVVGPDGGFVLFDEPPTVRAPDVAFVAEARLTFDTRKFAPLAPDLAVEIVSPSNTVSEIHHKVMDYLDAGSRLVWVVDPGSRTVTVYRSREAIRLLTEGELLEGGDVLPGFHVEVSELLGRQRSRPV